MLTWTTELEEQTKSQSEAFRKDTDLSKKRIQLTPHCSPAPKKPQTNGDAPANS
jgi:conjugal transfer ATP-binding protein TraC